MARKKNGTKKVSVSVVTSLSVLITRSISAVSPLLARVQNVEFDFEHDRIDWTLNQFAVAFYTRASRVSFLILQFSA